MAISLRTVKIASCVPEKSGLKQLCLGGIVNNLVRADPSWGVVVKPRLSIAFTGAPACKLPNKV